MQTVQSAIAWRIVSAGPTSTRRTLPSESALQTTMRADPVDETDLTARLALAAWRATRSWGMSLVTSRHDGRIGDGRHGV